MCFPSDEGGDTVYRGVWVSPARGRDTVYDTVESFKKEDISLFKSKVAHRIPLVEVVNIHNSEGIASLDRVREMRGKILSGEHVLEESGIPNVKLVWTDSGRLLLFDGHHTFLAYMMAGRRFLHEIPHLIVECPGLRYCTAGDISAFYGQHASRSAGRWRKYVIDWGLPGERQLRIRREKNMGELFTHLIERRASR